MMHCLVFYVARHSALLRPAGSKQAAARPAAPAGGLWYEEDVAAVLLPAEAARPLSEEDIEAARVRADAALDAERAAFEREQGVLSTALPA